MAKIGKIFNPVVEKSFQLQNKFVTSNSPALRNVSSKILIIPGAVSKAELIFGNKQPCSSCNIRKSMPNWLIEDYKIIKLEEAVRLVEQWNERPPESFEEFLNLEQAEKKHLTKDASRLEAMKDELHKYSLAWEWQRKNQQQHQLMEKSKYLNEGEDNYCCMKYLRAYWQEKAANSQNCPPMKKLKVTHCTSNKPCKSNQTTNEDLFLLTDDNTHKMTDTATSSIPQQNNVNPKKSYTICRPVRNVSFPSNCGNSDASNITQKLSTDNKSEIKSIKNNQTNNYRCELRSSATEIRTKCNSCQTEDIIDKNDKPSCSRLDGCLSNTTRLCKVCKNNIQRTNHNSGQRNGKDGSLSKTLPPTNKRNWNDALGSDDFELSTNGSFKNIPTSRRQHLNTNTCLPSMDCSKDRTYTTHFKKYKFNNTPFNFYSPLSSKLIDVDGQLYEDMDASPYLSMINNDDSKETSQYHRMYNPGCYNTSGTPQPLNGDSKFL